MNEEGLRNLQGPVERGWSRKIRFIGELVSGAHEFYAGNTSQQIVPDIILGRFR